MRARRLSAVLAAACTAIAANSLSLSAADRFWIGPDGGAFEDPANWSPPLPNPPGPSDNAIFNQTLAVPPHTVTFASNPVNSRLLVRSDTVRFASFDGLNHDYTLTSASVPGVVVGELTGNVANLTVLSGIRLIAENTAIGQAATSAGRLTVSGGAIRNNAALTIGQSGSGSLTVNQAGAVTTASAFIGQATTSTGSCLITGPGSTLAVSGAFRVAVRGGGRVDVTGGGVLNTGTLGTANAILGLYSGCRGEVVVDGEGSAWRLPASDLIVGREGEGFLAAGNGGAVTARTASFGAAATGFGQAVISGAGPSGVASAIDVSQALTVADAGRGEVYVQVGGQLSSGDAVIGAQIASDGLVAVTDPGSVWNLGQKSLTVGRAGTGTVELSLDARLFSGDAILGEAVSGEGTLTLDAAVWMSTGRVHVGLDGSGYMEIIGGGALTSSTGAVGATSVPVKSGDLYATVWLFGTNSRWEMAGPLDVGIGRDGAIYVESGASLVSGPATVGSDGGYGTVEVTIKAANRSSWQVNGPLIVGSGGDGSGKVSVDDGCRLTSTAAVIGDHDLAVGEVIISDAGSIWETGTLDIGVFDASQGFLTVKSGGAVQSGSVSIGGDGAGWGGNGYASVSGLGAGGVPATWNIDGDLTVGNGGIGELLVSASGVVRVTGRAELGTSSPFTDGRVGLVGAASLFAVGGELAIGYDGTGTLSIDGGTVTCDTAAVGALPGSRGVAALAQPSSLWHVGRGLYIGGDAFGPGGRGTVSVRGGAQLRADGGIVVYKQGELIVADPDISAPTILLDGGILRGTGVIAPPLVSTNGVVIADAGQMSLAGGLLITSTLRKTGLGLLAVAGPQNHNAGTSLDITEGSVHMHGNAGGPLGTRNLRIALAGGTVVRFLSSQDLAAVNVGDTALAELVSAGDRVIDTDALFIGAAGKVDLWNNALIVRSTPAASDADLARITGYIRSARNTLPPWQGPGLTTGSGPAQPLHGLAVMLNRGGDGLPVHSVFAGRPVDENSILVRYTLEGDANLDGVIDALDYFRIDQGYLNGLARYQDGDFDYDMTVGPDDYMLIDAAYLHQFAKSRQAAMELAVVPEPGGMLFLAAAAAGLLIRRRRR